MFICFSEADTQDWCTFTVNFFQHFDSVTAQYKDQHAAQNSQLETD